jgi:hypothetical protein
MERMCLTNIVYTCRQEPPNNLAMRAVESTEPRRKVMVPLAGLSRYAVVVAALTAVAPQVTKKKPQAFAVAESHDPRNDPTGE